MSHPSEKNRDLPLGSLSGSHFGPPEDFFSGANDVFNTPVFLLTQETHAFLIKPNTGASSVDNTVAHIGHQQFFCFRFKFLTQISVIKISVIKI